MATMTTQASPLRQRNEAEPNQAWRDELRRKIEAELAPMLEKAKQDKEERLQVRTLTEEERKSILSNYDQEMESLREIAKEEYARRLAAEKKRRILGKFASSSPQASGSILDTQYAIMQSFRGGGAESGKPGEDVTQEHRETGGSSVVDDDSEDESPSTMDWAPRSPDLYMDSVSTRYQSRREFTHAKDDTSAVQTDPEETSQFSYNQPGVTRKVSNGSISSMASKDGYWRPGGSPQGNLPASRTYNIATSPPSSATARQDSASILGFNRGIASSIPPHPSPSPVSPRRDSNVSVSSSRSGAPPSRPFLARPEGDSRRGSPVVDLARESSPTVSRAGSTAGVPDPAALSIPIPHPPPSPLSQVPPTTTRYRSGISSSAPRSRSPLSAQARNATSRLVYRGSIDSMEERFLEMQYTLDNRRSGRPGNPYPRGRDDGTADASISHSLSAGDIQPSLGVDPHQSSAPITSPLSPDFPQTPDSELDRPGVPIPPKSGRALYAPQASPEFSKSLGRSARKSRYGTGEGARYASRSPEALRSMFGHPLYKMARRDSAGSYRSGRSSRSGSSRPEAYRPYLEDYPGPEMETYEEQSHTGSPSDIESDWDGGIFDLDDRRREEASLSQLTEEMKKREEELKSKEREAERKLEDAKAVEAAAKRREDEAKRKEDEAKRKEDGVLRREDEVRQREEEVRDREDEVRRREDEARRREEDARRKEEDARRKEEDARKKEDDARKKEEDARQRAEEARLRVEEAKQREEGIWTKGEALRKKEEELRRLEEELNERESQLAQREAESMQQEEDEADMAETLRQEKARAEQRRALAELAAAEEAKAERARAELAQRRAEEERQRAQQVRAAEQALQRKEEELRKREEELARKKAEQEQEDAKRMAEILARLAAEEHMTAEQLVQEQERISTGIAAQQRRQRLAEETAQRLQQEEARKASSLAERERQARADHLAQEEERKRREEVAEAKRREELHRQQEQARQAEEQRRQEEMRRRAEERKRQDSLGSNPDTNRSSTPYSSASQPSGRSIPNRNSTASTSSSGTSSSWSSAAGSAWSNWSAGTSSTHTSATPRASQPPPTSAKTPAGAWRAAASSGYAQPQTDEEREKAWKERQEEQARKQHEQFKKEQERMERERQMKGGRMMTKAEYLHLVEERDRQWSVLQTMSNVTWNDIPWPALKKPSTVEELTTQAIAGYVLSPYTADRSSKDRLKDHIRRWHPDRFETKLLPKVQDGDRERVKEAAGQVVRCLNELMTQAG